MRYENPAIHYNTDAHLICTVCRLHAVTVSMLDFKKTANFRIFTIILFQSTESYNILVFITFTRF